MAKKVKSSYVGMKSFVVMNPSEQFLEKCIEIDPECTMTNAQILDSLVELSEDESQLQKVKELSDANERLKAENDGFSKKIDELNCTINKLNENGEVATSLQNKYDDLERQYNELLAKQENKDQDGGVTLYEPTQKILEIAAKKLTERNKREVSVSEIINMMVLRYNVERWTEWFYPFSVISQKEIEDITGKSFKELKEYFNK